MGWHVASSPSRALAPTPAGDDAVTVVRWSALGTACSLQFPATLGETGQRFAEAAQRWVARFEARYSRFRPDSLISQINARAGQGWVPIDEEMERVLEVCGQVHALSQGILDVTALPLLQLWSPRGGPFRLPSAGEVAEARTRVGWTRVERRPGAVRLPLVGMGLDLGGWGKEYAVDAVVGLARQHGLTSLLVDFGHDVFALGTPPGRPAWHIGLEDPVRPGESRGSVALVNRAVASSGDYQRGVTHEGRRYGHILDPRTGFPVAHGLRQATVVAGSCLQAGLYSTTCFVLGAEAGIRLLDTTMGVAGLLRTETVLHQSRTFSHHVVQAP